MFLIGQYDSPFTRRVAIAMRLYGLAFEHRPWSTFGEGDKIAPYNPLRRVPTLVLDDGEALIESTAILDYLDELVGPEKAMIAARGPARRHALEDLRAGDRARRQGGEPRLRARAAQGAVENLGRSLRGAGRRRAGGAGKGARRRRDAVVVRRHASAMPTSRWPAFCDLPARRIRRCFPPRAIRRWRRIARPARRCRCLPKSRKHWRRRAGIERAVSLSLPARGTDKRHSRRQLICPSGCFRDSLSSPF